MNRKRSCMPSIIIIIIIISSFKGRQLNVIENWNWKDDVKKDLRKMGISWDEVEEAAVVSNLTKY